MGISSKSEARCPPAVELFSKTGCVHGGSGRVLSSGGSRAFWEKGFVTSAFDSEECIYFFSFG